MMTDEEILLQGLLAEYSGSWRDRQYREHIIKEVQKKKHLQKLIAEHIHDPKEQILLESSKRKTVDQIELKFAASTINKTYEFILKRKNSTSKSSSRSSSSHSSLETDCYNLNTQNTDKNMIKKPILMQTSHDFDNKLKESSTTTKSILATELPSTIHTKQKLNKEQEYAGKMQLSYSSEPRSNRQDPHQVNTESKRLAKPSTGYLIERQSESKDTSKHQPRNKAKPILQLYTDIEQAVSSTNSTTNQFLSKSNERPVLSLEKEQRKIGVQKSTIYFDIERKEGQSQQPIGYSYQQGTSDKLREAISRAVGQSSQNVSQSHLPQNRKMFSVLMQQQVSVNSATTQVNGRSQGIHQKNPDEQSPLMQDQKYRRIAPGPHQTWAQVLQQDQRKPPQNGEDVQSSTISDRTNISLGTAELSSNEVQVSAKMNPESARRAARKSPNLILTDASNSSSNNLLNIQHQPTTYKNKWIDFKQNYPSSKDNDTRRAGLGLNQTHLLESSSISISSNMRSTKNSMSPNSNIKKVIGSGSSQSSLNQKSQFNINSISQQSVMLSTQGKSITSPAFTLLAKQPSHHQITVSKSSLNQQAGSNGGRNSAELAIYQIKSGRLNSGYGEKPRNSSSTSAITTQIIGNSNITGQKQMVTSESLSVFPENEEISVKAKQIQQRNKLNQCKSMEINEKFTGHSGSSFNKPSLSSVNQLSMSNYLINLSSTTNQMALTTSHYLQLPDSSKNVSAQQTIQAIGGTSNYAQSNSYLQHTTTAASNSAAAAAASAATTLKNTYSAALYQKSQNNILNKQDKKQTQKSTSAIKQPLQNYSVDGISSQVFFNDNQSHQKNNQAMVKHAEPVQQRTSGNQKNDVFNFVQLVNQSNDGNISAKFSKKTEILKGLNVFNSNSFNSIQEPMLGNVNSNNSTIQFYQTSPSKQQLNLGQVLQKIIKNKSQIAISDRDKSSSSKSPLSGTTIATQPALYAAASPSHSTAKKNSSTPSNCKPATKTTHNFASQIKQKTQI